MDIPYTKAYRTREFAQKLLFKIVGEAVEFCNGKNVSYIAVAMQGDVVTVNSVVGEFTKEEKTMIHTVCKRMEAIKLRNRVRQIDPNSFIIITTSSEIIGRGFRGV